MLKRYVYKVINQSPDNNYIKKLIGNTVFAIQIILLFLFNRIRKTNCKSIQLLKDIYRFKDKLLPVLIVTDSNSTIP